LATSGNPLWNSKQLCQIKRKRLADHLFSWFAGPKPIDNNQIGDPDVKQEQLKSDERFDFATQTWQPTSAKKAKEG
jgi:hypothetical protein